MRIVGVRLVRLCGMVPEPPRPAEPKKSQRKYATENERKYAWLDRNRDLHNARRRAAYRKRKVTH